MKGIPYVDIDYCQFSDWGYQKPTRIWGCLQTKVPDKVCDGRTCPNLRPGPPLKAGHLKRHKERLGGNELKLSPLMKGRIPSRAIEYIMNWTGLEQATIGRDRSTPGSSPFSDQTDEPDAAALRPHKPAINPNPGDRENNLGKAFGKVTETADSESSTKFCQPNLPVNRIDDCGLPDGATQVAGMFPDAFGITGNHHPSPR